MHFSISATAVPTPEEFLSLYVSVGWLDDDDSHLGLLQRMLEGPATFLAARTDGGELVGMAKTLSDGAFYTTVAEIIVREDYRRWGIGRAMMSAIREQFAGMPIFIAAFEYNRAFFESCGFTHRPKMMVMSAR